MTSRARLLVLSISTPVLAFAVIGGFLGNAVAREDTYRHLRVFEDVVSLITNNYVEEVEMTEVMRGAMRGLADGLDPDSSYLRQDEVRSIEQGGAGPEGEVGLTLTRQYYLRVVAVRDGSPAARAGIMTGDAIRAIDGKSTRDTSSFTGTRLLRGAPGSKVTLAVIRGNIADPHSVELVREKLATPAVTGRIAAPGVGYVRIPAFATTSPAQVTAKVAELTRAGATRLLVDIRRTADGPFDAGVATARLFVPSGTLITREARGETVETVAAQPGDGAIQLPTLLLVSNGTSGVAEVFAAALTGNNRAEIVGERSSGRAALQKLIKLPDGTGLWMTWSRYVAPSGTAIQGKGLEPVVQIDEPDVEFGGAPPSTDPILEKALERLAVPKAA